MASAKTELSRTQIREKLESCRGYQKGAEYHVYVLEFEDWQENTVYYVGQSKRPKSRIGGHAKNFGHFSMGEKPPEMIELFLVDIVRVKSTMKNPRILEREVFKETILRQGTTEVYGGR